MLRQVLVGPSGLRSSEIALGTMTFGDSRAWGCTASEAEAIMQCFVEAGGTTIDTEARAAIAGIVSALVIAGLVPDA